MVGLLIIFAVMGLGFAAGYGVRAIISRRRRRLARRNGAKAHARRHEASAGRDEAINLERLLGAANDDSFGRKSQQARNTPDELDGAVRDLLAELGRRAAGPSAAPRRVRQ